MGDAEHVPGKICRLKVREFARIPGLSADSSVSSHSRGATAVARMLCKEIKTRFSKKTDVSSYGKIPHGLLLRSLSEKLGPLSDNSMLSTS